MTPTATSTASTDFPDILRSSWTIFRSSFGLITLFLIIFELPAGILSNLTGFLLPGESGTMSAEAIRTTLVLGFVSIPFGMLSIVSMILITAGRTSNAIPVYHDTLQKTLALFLRGLATTLLMLLAILLWSMLLIIPGIIFAVRYAFALQAAVLRDQPAPGAIAYSNSLVKGRWWLVALTLLGLYVPTLVLAVFFPSLAADSLAFIVISAIVTGYPSMFASIGTTVLFLRLDTARKPGS